MMLLTTPTPLTSPLFPYTTLFRSVNAELDDNKLTIRAGKSRFTLATLPASEFPSSDQAETLQTYEVDQKTLRALLDKTAFAMANNDVRHYLNGLLVEFGEKTIRAVATDGHRLSLAEAEMTDRKSTRLNSSHV